LVANDPVDILAKAVDGSFQVLDVLDEVIEHLAIHAAATGINIVQGSSMEKVGSTAALNSIG
jgi:hypothetical protein